MRRPHSGFASFPGVRFSRLSAFPLLLGLVVAAGIVAPGCSREESIISYTVDKPKPFLTPDELARLQREINPDAPEPEIPEGHPPLDSSSPAAGPPQKMLAAITIHGDTGWFFKMQGPIPAVSRQLEPFTQFLRSLTFNDQGRPEWKLPAGWESQPGSQMRFATIRVPSDSDPVELTVIPLPYPGGERDEYILANVNRWRGQLGLQPLTLDGLYSSNSRTEEVHETSLNGRDVIVVNIQSQATGEAMAGGRTPPAQAAADEAPVTLAYDTPEGWGPGKAGSFRKAAFLVEEGGKQVEITVIDLAANSGSLLDNVNRWRGQVNLPPIDEAQLQNDVTEINVDGRTGHYVKLVGPEGADPRQTILGVIVAAGGRAWYLKLQGDADLAARQQPNFESFVQSIKFKN